MWICDRGYGLDPSTSIVWPSIQAWLISSQSHHNDTQQYQSSNDKRLILAHTYAIKPSGLQFWELRGGFLCLAPSSPPLLSVPLLVNSPTWPRLPIQSFDELVSAICLAKHKCICECAIEKEREG